MTPEEREAWELHHNLRNGDGLGNRPSYAKIAEHTVQPKTRVFRNARSASENISKVERPELAEPKQGRRRDKHRPRWEDRVLARIDA